MILFRIRRSTLSSQLRLPSISSTFTLSDHESSGGHRFGLISDGTFHTVILQCWPTARVVDASMWHALWGDAVRIDRANQDLATLTAIWDIAPATEDSFSHWRSGYAVAAEALAPVALISATFRSENRGRRATADAAVNIGIRLPALLESLHIARVPSVPMTSTQITARLAQTFAPRSDIDLNDLKWADCVPPGTEESRHYLSHPDGCRSTSWLIHARNSDDVHTLTERVLSPTLPAFPRRRIALSYRRIRSDSHGYDIGLLRRQATAMTVITPSAYEPDMTDVVGTGPTELSAACRLGLRRAYDRQGELAALTSGVGIVLPEHAAVTSHPVFRDHLLDTAKAS